MTTFLVIGTGEGPPDLEAGLRMAENREGFYATVGVHPHDAAKATYEVFERLRKLAQHPKVVAIGEIGLDFHYNFSPPDVQERVFIEQLTIAREIGLPVVIHTREAWMQTLDILQDHWSGRPGIMHCFTGGVVEAREALGLGLHLAFGGVLTFPNAQENREAARVVPDDRLLVETDAPYLAPVPHRGKRNEPAFLVETVKRLAQIRDSEPEKIAELTAANFERLCLAGRLPGDKPDGYTEHSHD